MYNFVQLVANFPSPYKLLKLLRDLLLRHESYADSAHEWTWKLLYIPGPTPY